MRWTTGGPKPWICSRSDGLGCAAGRPAARRRREGGESRPDACGSTKGDLFAAEWRLLVEEGCGAIEYAGVHGVEVGPHGGCRVGVAEHLLDVEEVGRVSGFG